MSFMPQQFLKMNRLGKIAWAIAASPFLWNYQLVVNLHSGITHANCTACTNTTWR